MKGKQTTDTVNASSAETRIFQDDWVNTMAVNYWPLGDMAVILKV